MGNAEDVFAHFFCIRFFTSFKMTEHNNKYCYIFTLTIRNFVKFAFLKK